MPNIGPMELAIVLVIALLVLGPKRFPETGRSLGRGLREFKDSIKGGDEPKRAELARVDTASTLETASPLETAAAKD